MKDLEDRVGCAAENPTIEPSNNRTWRSQAKDYIASASAGWIAYNPIMAPIEYFAADMEGWEVAKSRLIASTVGHGIGLPLYQKSKKLMTKLFRASEKSHWAKKTFVGAFAFVPTHPLSYGLSLLVAGASVDEIKIALPSGLGVVMATSVVFSPFMEFWRTRVWGLPPTYRTNLDTN